MLIIVSEVGYVKILIGASKVICLKNPLNDMSCPAFKGPTALLKVTSPAEELTVVTALTVGEPDIPGPETTAPAPIK